MVGVAAATLAYAWDLLRGEAVIRIGPAGTVAALLGLLLCGVALVTASRANARGRGERFVEAMVVTLASTVLAVGIVEGGLRVAGYGVREARFGRSLELVHRPHEAGTVGGRPYRLNSLALRDEELPRARQPGELRVLCLGDSSTFGYGVDREESYPERLEELLRDRHGGPVQVINAGYVSATSFQGRELYQRLARELEVDWVVAAFGHNDRWLRPLPDARGGTGKATALLAQSRLVILLTNLLARWLPPRTARFVPRVAPGEYGENLDRLARAAQAKGARVVLVSLPDNPDIGAAVASAEASLARDDWPGAFKELMPVTRLAMLNPYPEAFDLLARVSDHLDRKKIAARARHEAGVRRRLAPRLEDEGSYRQAVVLASAATGAVPVLVLPTSASHRLIDICHPSPAFHCVIARAIERAIVTAEPVVVATP